VLGLLSLKNGTVVVVSAMPSPTTGPLKRSEMVNQQHPHHLQLPLRPPVPMEPETAQASNSSPVLARTMPTVLPAVVGSNQESVLVPSLRRNVTVDVVSVMHNPMI
jgi:hypothetical protein